MLKKFLICLVGSALILTLFIGLSSLKINAAVCEPQSGGTCEGECCITLLGGGCVAGPCDKILK